MSLQSAPETGRKAVQNGHVETIPNGINGYGPKETMTNGHGHKDLPNGHGPKETNRSSRSTKTKSHNTNSTDYQVDISQEISKAVQSLKTDLDRLSNRINNLEKNSSNTAMTKYKYISFSNISPSLLAFLIIWPFVTHSVLRYWSNRK